MAEWKPDPETAKLIRMMEKYTGRKCPKVTEEQMNAAWAKLIAWDAAGRPFDEDEVPPKNKGPFL